MTAERLEIRAADHGVVLDQLRVGDSAGEHVDVKVGDDARDFVGWIG